MGFPFENRRPVVFAVFADKIETVSGLSLSIHGNPNEAWSKIRLTANRAHGSRREDSERAIDHEDLTLLDVFDRANGGIVKVAGRRHQETSGNQCQDSDVRQKTAGHSSLF